MYKLGKVIKEVFIKFVNDNCSIYAASLTYVTLLALVPFLIVFFKIFSFFSFFRVFESQLQNYLFHNFFVSSVSFLQKSILGFVAKGVELSSFSTITLLITLVLMIMNITAIFDRIWHVTDKKQTFFSYLKYVLVIILLPIAVGSLLLVNQLVMIIPHVNVVTAISQPLILMALFFCLYYFAPNCKVNGYATLISSLITTGLFTLLKKFFSFYVSHFSNYEMLYGIFSIIPIFLVWIYALWIVILLGVVIDFAITKYYFKGDSCLVESNQSSK